MNVIREGERSERRDEELETRITGLEALLCDAQAEIERQGVEAEKARDCIETLEAEYLRLRAALAPFAKTARRLRCDERPINDGVDIVMSVAALRRAAELVPE